MERNNQTGHQDTSQDHNHVWKAFSIGALSGAVIFLVLALISRLRLIFFQDRGKTQSNLMGRQDYMDRGSLKSGLKSVLYPGTVSGNISAIDQVDVSEPGGEVGGSGASAGESKSKAVLTPVGVQIESASKTGEMSFTTINTTQQPTSKRWSTPTRYIMGVMLFLAILTLLFIGRSTIPLVVAAALLAVVLNPVILFFSRRLKYNLAVSLTYFLVVLLVLAFPLLAIPALGEAVDFFTKIDYTLMIQQMEDRIQNIISLLQANPAWAGIVSDIEEYLVSFLDNFASQYQPSSPGFSLSFGDITSGVGRALGTVTGILGPTFSALASLFLTILISLQMTLTTNEMKDWTSDFVPQGYEPELTGLITKIRHSWTGFLRGQILLMLVIGVVTWLGGLILGLPGALLLGIIAGFMELIPSIGPVIAAIPAVLLALLFGSTHFTINHLLFALIVVVFYGLVQLLENQLLVPRIMGDAVDLPPLVVLIGIIAGAGAFGILGALLATPVIATGNLVFRYIYGKIVEAPPPPVPVEDRPGILGSMRNFLSRFRRPNTSDPSRGSSE